MNLGIQVPASMQTRGPVPGSIIVSLMSQDTAADGTLVTFGTDDRTCAIAGATDVVIGWSQGKMVENTEASIHLFAPMWLVNVAATSQAIEFGDTLEMVAGGKVKHASGAGATIIGYAMQDGIASGQVLMIAVQCCPAVS